jgi:hypothetical protein
MAYRNGTRILTHLEAIFGKNDGRPRRRGFECNTKKRVLFRCHDDRRTLCCEQIGPYSDMKSQTLWDRIDVGLPDLPYDMNNLAAKRKGSTTWAPHSHTPVSISKWDAFDECIRAEGAKHENSKVLDADVVAELNIIKLQKVYKEELVTNNTITLLRPLSDLSTFEFTTTDEFTMSNPDLVA